MKNDGFSSYDEPSNGRTLDSIALKQDLSRRTQSKYAQKDQYIIWNHKVSYKNYMRKIGYI